MLKNTKAYSSNSLCLEAVIFKTQYSTYFDEEVEREVVANDELDDGVQVLGVIPS